MVPHVFGWFTMTSVWFILCAQLENAKRDIDEVSDNNIPEWVEATIYGSLLIFMNFAFVSCSASNLHNSPSLHPAALCCQAAPPTPVPCLADSNRLPTWHLSIQTRKTRPLSTLSLLFTFPLFFPSCRPLPRHVLGCVRARARAQIFESSNPLRTASRMTTPLTRSPLFPCRYRDFVLPALAARQALPGVVPPDQRDLRRRVGGRHASREQRGAEVRPRREGEGSARETWTFASLNGMQV